MSTVSHPIAQEEIMAHLDGELSADRSQSVSAHLESCPTCQELVTSLRNTSHTLSNWTVASLPVHMEDIITQASVKPLPHADDADSNWSMRIPRWTRNQWVAGLAATLAAVVLVFFIVNTNMQHSGMQKDKAISTVRLALSAPEARSVDGQPITDQQSKLYYTRRIPFEALSQPGVAADSNGQFHGLGDKAAKSEGGGFGFGMAPGAQNAEQLEGPMIARTLSLSIVAKDFDASRASLDAILVRHSGYAADLNVATPQGAARSLQASLRIPAPQLSAALAELKSLGRVELETQNGEEVTQQHADLVARLKNSRETEQRLQAILTERTGKISDVLSVEQEIARVRGEIEQMEAEQKNLEHRVDFATIDLKLSEEYKAKLDSPSPAISTLIHNAAVSGYRNVADTLLSIILFFAEFGPVLAFWLLLLALPATLVWRRWCHAIAN